ncbi:hypothetical protein C8F04DRAFT_371690 [Mycena alexandri]|uniref:Uncharacterized protein n=1 Tax=Mycena alexandri TaxID=1745969 RepID=A0AAD6T3J8_9AGAR|nr:hypothetical protein C8F04DRAFT_371690 [Mycena alexandri]
MPSIARAILLAVHAASFLALTGLSPATTNALASPLASPAFPPNSPSSLLAARVVTKHTDADLVARAPTTTPAATRNQTASDHVKRIHDLSVKMKGNAANMKRYAAQAKSKRTRDASGLAFQQLCTTEVTRYNDNFADFRGILVLLPNDAGLLCYDRTDDVETYLKDIINAHKEIVAATVEIVDCIPILGPILAPLMEQVKCLVDEILDIVENYLDCLFAMVGPLLQSLGLGPVADSLTSLLCSLGVCLGTLL